MISMFKCPLCPNGYSAKKPLYSHLEGSHPEQLRLRGGKEISPAQLYFNYKNRYSLTKGNGRCIVCGEPTDFNDATERYERLHPGTCAEKYRAQFVDRMKKRYGKEHLLDDPEKQKEMLAGRAISGEYVWTGAGAGKKFVYTGSYELDLLETLDKVFGFPSSDVYCPAPQVFFYFDEKEKRERMYIPDCYVSSVNLIIEVKAAENKHYRLRDVYQETAKKDILGNTMYNFLFVYDKNYDALARFLIQIKDDRSEAARRSGRMPDAAEDLVVLMDRINSIFGTDIPAPALIRLDKPVRHEGQIGDLPPEASGGSWTKYGVVLATEGHLRKVAKYYGVEMPPLDFRRIILAHELGHHAYRSGKIPKARIDEFVKKNKLKEYKYLDGYVDKSKPDKYAEELFCETLANYVYKF